LEGQRISVLKTEPDIESVRVLGYWVLNTGYDNDDLYLAYSMKIDAVAIV
jgi:hypothetical protein